MQEKALPAGAIQIALAVILSASTAAFADCKEPKTGTTNVPLFSPPLSEIVVGAGVRRDGGDVVQPVQSGIS